jgi:AAA domain-containing protein
VTVLIWINGAFGVGKTSVARALAQRWPAALLFDPEQIGFMLRRVTSLEPQGDFQDVPLWRTLTVQAAIGTLAQYRRPLIVPMTLVVPAYHREIIGGLRKSGAEVHHFSLMASPHTLSRRIRWRLVRPAAKRWMRAQIERCVATLNAPEFATHVATDDRSIADVVDVVLATLPKPLPASLPTSSIPGWDPCADQGVQPAEGR